MLNWTICRHQKTLHCKCLSSSANFFVHNIVSSNICSHLETIITPQQKLYKVLIVHHSKQMQNFLSFLFERTVLENKIHGKIPEHYFFQIITTSNAYQGQAILSESSETFQYFIVSEVLPVMKGTQFLEWIQRKYRHVNQNSPLYCMLLQPRSKTPKNTKIRNKNITKTQEKNTIVYKYKSPENKHETLSHFHFKRLQEPLEPNEFIQAMELFLPIRLNEKLSCFIKESCNQNINNAHVDSTIQM